MKPDIRNHYPIKFEFLGRKDYKEVWDYQELLFKQIVNDKLSRREAPKNDTPSVSHHLLFVEHPHVYTLGKSGDENNLLMNAIQLKAQEADFYKINRGGDITYHGPGQLVGYPIIDLERYGLGVREYIERLEEVIIASLDAFGIKAYRMEGAIGVWLDPEIPGKSRKICAIGVRISRYVTMHGFALNINTDLNYFTHINPCGFMDKGVTSMEKELGEKQDFNRVAEVVKQKMAEVFGFEFVE